MTRRVGIQMQRVPSSLLLYCICTLVQAVTVEALFLERGHRGIVPCPLSKSCMAGDVDAMYWFYGSTSDTFLLISYFKGSVAPQNGIPEGVYDIDEECNLIIENVTASNEGTYYYKLKPHLRTMLEGQIEVCDKVAPSRPYPTVIECNQDHDADTCEVRVRHDSTVHNLTCVMEQVKPAVELKWFLVGLTELKASTAVRSVVLPANTGSSLRNNTYSTSATIQVPSDYNDIEYVCEAMGVAVGSSTTRTRVRLTKTKPTRATYDGAFLLERGHRGIVPCPLSQSCKILAGDVDAMYWFYGSPSDTFLLISYFKGSVAPQNGIPEGVYDIDSECNLIIENVTASNEGTYYYKLKPHLLSMEYGQIEVCDKVAPSRSYPTVIGCNQDHDADTCEVRVRHDSTVHNLTCVMEQVKPPVQLRWFLGGLMELKASTAVRPVVLPANTGLWLRNNTFSTSAAIQVPSDDNDIEYVCEATGVAVRSSSTRTRVRLAKTKPSTATYNEVQSSINPGTTLALTDGIPIPNVLVFLIATLVVTSISLIGFVAACVYIMIGRLKKKQSENNRAGTYATVPMNLYTPP